MASKNPNTPTRARATKRTTTTRPAAPRRRAATRTPAPAETAPEIVAEEPVSAGSTIGAPEGTPIDHAEHVRTRAYFLSLERRGRQGNPVEDWLTAEREFGNGAGR